jgi:flagellar biogenesis protein FliO
MKNSSIRVGGLASSFFILHSAFAQTTNSVPALPPVPEVGLSFLRVLGALILVIAIFLLGVWLFRNWQRLALNRGRAPQLNVLETRSLGGRQALYVVGYDRERFLLSASPTGVNLLTHLPPADESEPASVAAATPQPTVAFGQVLAQMLRGGK